MEKTRTYLHLTNEGELEFVVSRAINVKELADDEIKVMLKHTKSSLMKQRDDYKKQRDELSEKLDKECNDNYKLEGQLHDMTKKRDSLIKDVEKLREEKAAIEMYLDAVKTYKPMYECVNDKYKYLTNYIKDKALHNPSVSRYIDLVHVIDELEKE
ncbi:MULTISPECIES: hypothetical protein [unclassified Mammaliicoccus]|uniref:hypothetical protein n=1 Tax=unclassified Mammaliicoccus TaxID=2803851 RepID=UPI001EFA77E2|nr:MULTISPECIES: hypothetical protein [unclassified Mammaliicoccus]